ncbi:MAG TPA: class D sortase [Gaiellaceae bacterium]|nr:class D sortase [Gaiellaceae bacterium]
MAAVHGSLVGETAPPRRAVERHVHRLGTVLLLAGVLVLAWAVVVWRWSDPVSGLYTRYEQHGLSSRLEAVVANTRPPSPSLAAVAAAARQFRHTARPGDPIGRLAIPRLHVSFVFVEGTDTASLRLGPGRDARSFMPGEGNLVYVAGHRTTYAAPFAQIDALRPGDTIRLTMPYGTFRYVVTGHSIVAADDLRALRPRRVELLALQACHPRFFATQRYIVWARLRTVTTAQGRILYERTAGSSRR